MYALDAATGHLRWTYTTGDTVDSSPAVEGGIVYIGSTDDTVYALKATQSLNLNSAANPNSKLLQTLHGRHSRTPRRRVVEPRTCRSSWLGNSGSEEPT